MNAMTNETGRTLAAAFALAALTALTPAPALAKDMLPDETQRAEAIAEGYDENILQDYWPYFEYAQKENGGSCCGFKDAMVVDPADVEETGDPEKPYRVLIRRSSSGLQLEEPYWLEIVAEKVLDSKQSAKICETYNDAAEAQNIDAFCSVPPFDVVFLNDFTRYDTKTKMHSVVQYSQMSTFGNYGVTKYYPSGHVLTPEEASRSVAEYCFQPAPQGF